MGFIASESRVESTGAREVYKIKVAGLFCSFLIRRRGGPCGRPFCAVQLVSTHPFPNQGRGMLDAHLAAGSLQAPLDLQLAAGAVDSEDAGAGFVDIR